MSRRRLILITLGILLSIFLSSMEGTVVATAMPSIVAQLGGLSIYSWVFAIYMLASTSTVPVYGKLSDLLGRRPVYTFSMGLFLVGSVLCAQAQTMEQLVLFRAIQGLGAGGVLPLAFTIIGEIFSLEERARMQGVISGVWGVSSVIGPLIGGFLVDEVSWQWVFLINLIPGGIAICLVWFSWRDGAAHARGRVRVDYAGAALLTLGTLCLLLGLNELGKPLGWIALVGAMLLFASLVWVERRAEDPILPVKLLRDRLFSVSLLHGVLAGWAMFGSLNYVPLFAQAVLATSATQAGITLTPMSLSWTVASIIAGPLLLRMGYRTLSLAGSLLLATGALLMAQIGLHTTQIEVMVYTSLMGLGMGLSIPALLIAVQTSVSRRDLGTATSSIQFSRSIGGTLGVSVMGAVLASGLVGQLLAAGIDPAASQLESLLSRTAPVETALEGSLRQALAGAMANIFMVAFIAAVLSLATVFFAPKGSIAQLARQSEPGSLPEV